jgi:hypothetical protein
MLGGRLEQHDRRSYRRAPVLMSSDSPPSIRVTGDCAIHRLSDIADLSFQRLAGVLSCVLHFTHESARGRARPRPAPPPQGGFEHRPTSGCQVRPSLARGHEGNIAGPGPSGTDKEDPLDPVRPSPARPDEGPPRTR